MPYTTRLLPAGEWAEWAGPLWSWLEQDRRANLDDYGPATEVDFRAVLEQRAGAGELLWGVAEGDRPVGAIGYQPITPRLGTLHGVCFDRAVHGTGAAAGAMAAVLGALGAVGVQKVMASVFADNERVARFLRKQGFVDEGVLAAQTLREGQPVSMRLLAMFLE